MYRSNSTMDGSDNAPVYQFARAHMNWLVHFFALGQLRSGMKEKLIIEVTPKSIIVPNIIALCVFGDLPVHVVIVDIATNYA